MRKHLTSSLRYFLFFLKFLAYLIFSSTRLLFSLSFSHFPLIQSISYISIVTPSFCITLSGNIHHFCCFRALSAPSLLWSLTMRVYSGNCCIAYWYSRPQQFCFPKYFTSVLASTFLSLPLFVLKIDLSNFYNQVLLNFKL